MKTAIAKRMTLIGTAALLLLGHGSVHAIPIVYTDQGAFETAASVAGISLGLEDFDAFATSEDLQTNPVSMGGVTVSGSSDDTQLRDTFVNTPGKAPMIRSSTTGGDSITFTFSSAINAIGFDIFDLGTALEPTTLTLTTSGGAQILFENLSDQDGDQRFGGVIDTTSSFATAMLMTSGAGDFVEFDNMRTGTIEPVGVPLPSTVALLVAGLAGLLVLGYRDSSRESRRQ